MSDNMLLNAIEQLKQARESGAFDDLRASLTLQRKDLDVKYAAECGRLDGLLAEMGGPVEAPKAPRAKRRTRCKAEFEGQVCNGWKGHSGPYHASENRKWANENFDGAATA